MADEYIQPREADRIWKKIDDVENGLRGEITSLRAEIGRKDDAIEKLRVSKDDEVGKLTEQISDINLALAVTGALSGYKKYLFGLVLGLLMTGLGAWLGKIKW